jgi:hypothetical protein
MSWQSIHPSIPHWLRRHPLALGAAVAGLNRIRRSVGTRRSVFVVCAAALVAVLLVIPLVSDNGAVFVMQTLGYPGIVVAVSGLYAASVVSKRRRTVETARMNSWLVSTPRAARGSVQTVLLTTLPLLWRLALVVAAALLLSLDTSVSIAQSLQLSALITIGSAVGGPGGWWLARRSPEQRNESSRYTPRRKHAVPIAPSNAPLSRWPIAQAFAWGRPENARLLLAAAILTVPGGTGIVSALSILVTCGIGSYLVALLIAIPHVGRAASRWLRSTPITFWAFAWPLARRALVHQFIGMLIAVGGMFALGASVSTTIYLGAVWLTLVVLTTATSLAECYRGRSPSVKTIFSAAAALLAEQRVHGVGISIAVLLTVVHLRIGASHERA